MSKGNSAHSAASERLKQAQELISEAMALLGDAGAKPTPVSKAPKAAEKKAAGDPDFTTPIRPFVKQHAVGMNGARKFALLVAYLAQGDEKNAIPLGDVKGHWNKMTDKSLLGMKFNRLYTNEAKNNDWVNSPAKGVYHLRPKWKAIFE